MTSIDHQVAGTLDKTECACLIRDKVEAIWDTASAPSVVADALDAGNGVGGAGRRCQRRRF